jgi:subtilisin family serine protease
VAGILGAKNNNIGIIGTAPGTPLWSARVFGAEGETDDAIVICGIDWVTSTRMDKDRSNDIQVANMSLGSTGTDTANCGKGNDPFHVAICRSVKAGVTYAVAAGNESTDFAATVPAAYDEVLTVTAMADFDGRPGGKAEPVCFNTPTPESDDKAATFSNFATLPEDRKHTVAAPGVCMLTTAPGGGLAVGTGTSAATPVIAGSVGLCIASGTCRGTPQNIMKKFLEVTREYNIKNPRYGFVGDPLRPIPNRYYGYLVNRSIF